MKIIVGVLAFVFIVVLLAALVYEPSSTTPPPPPTDKGHLVLVYDKDNPDPDKWVLRLHP